MSLVKEERPRPPESRCPSGGCPPAGRLREEAEREVPLHARPQLPAGEPRPEGPLPRRRHPLLDVLDHLLGGHPAEPSQKRRRHQGRVLDRPGRLGVFEPRPRRARQRQRERLLALVVRVVQDSHLVSSSSTRRPGTSASAVVAQPPVGALAIDERQGDQYCRVNRQTGMRRDQRCSRVLAGAGEKPGAGRRLSATSVSRR